MAVDKEKWIVEPHTPWQETTMGGVIPTGGNAKYYITGSWRANHPVFDVSKCKDCRLCFPVCPDSSIIIDKEANKMAGIDYDHCKGCGVCANTCPFGALTMAEGGQAE